MNCRTVDEECFPLLFGSGPGFDALWLPNRHARHLVAHGIDQVVGVASGHACTPADLLWRDRNLRPAVVLVQREREHRCHFLGFRIRRRVDIAKRGQSPLNGSKPGFVLRESLGKGVPSVGQVLNFVDLRIDGGPKRSFNRGMSRSTA